MLTCDIPMLCNNARSAALPTAQDLQGTAFTKARLATTWFLNGIRGEASRLAQQSNAHRRLAQCSQRLRGLHQSRLALTTGRRPSKDAAGSRTSRTHARAQTAHTEAGTHNTHTYRHTDIQAYICVCHRAWATLNYTYRSPRLRSPTKQVLIRKKLKNKNIYIISRL